MEYLHEKIDAIELDGLLRTYCGAFALMRENRSNFKLLCFCSGDIDMNACSGKN